jgi:hypothetical protein
VTHNHGPEARQFKWPALLGKLPSPVTFSPDSEANRLLKDVGSC